MDEDARQRVAGEVSLEDIQAAYQQAAELLGLDNFIRLSLAIGGTSLYIPKFDSIIAPARDRLILKEFTGGNYRELALKYNLTEVWVRQIINQDRLRRNQVSLFEEAVGE